MPMGSNAMRSTRGRASLRMLSPLATATAFSACRHLSSMANRSGVMTASNGSPRSSMPWVSSAEPQSSSRSLSMKPIPVGAKGSDARTVADNDLASHLDPTLAAVLSTPTMVAMMEHAAIDAIRTYLEPGESSVGMTIDVSHTAATPPGHRVRAEAELTKVEGRRLEFSVRAFDEVEEIGSGTHRRAVIDSAKFNDRIKSKKKS